jgi:hypothetical protein
MAAGEIQRAQDRDDIPVAIAGEPNRSGINPGRGLSPSGER